MRGFTKFALAVMYSYISVMAAARPFTEPSSSHSLVQRKAHSRLTSSDRLSTSGLDYMSWASKMVDEGKMYWANNTATSNSQETAVDTQGTTADAQGTNLDAQAAKAKYDLKNIACGFIGANDSEYESGLRGFCAMIAYATSYTLTEGTYILQDGICQDNENCDFIIEVSFKVAGGLIGDALPSVCEPVFNELWDNCNGNVGGTAEISVTDSGGTQTGTILAEFFAHDSGATCPANTDTSVCKSSTF